MSKLIITPSPHIHSGANSANIMLIVVAALLPAVCASIYFFGTTAIILYAVCIISSIVFEAAFNKIASRADTTNDWSALLTGLLLAMNLPPELPLWIAVIGSFVSIVVAKMVFGGLGGNPFNPALVGRVFVLISFPAQMTSYVLPFGVDGVSSATVLSAAKTYMQAGDGLLIGFQLPDIMPMIIGSTSGSLG
ncbi:MAG: RnfABCDGE type electron transport complex subunit D, partial [Deferribacteraceae bacterium]|nr:RnfABCDGE type electron transport complex subunit D [Deferribacteraceae bacterium]